VWLRDVWVEFQLWRTSRWIRKHQGSAGVVMAWVVHAFMEDGRQAQRDHLAHWFGYPVDAVSAKDGDKVCRCGARLVPLKADRSVLAVWHLHAYRGQ
jgi:hypothetical protein